MLSSRRCNPTDEGGSSSPEETSGQSGVKPSYALRPNHAQTSSPTRKSRTWAASDDNGCPLVLPDRSSSSSSSSSSSDSSGIRVIYMMDKSRRLYSSSSFDSAFGRPPFDTDDDDNTQSHVKKPHVMSIPSPNRQAEISRNYNGEKANKKHGISSARRHDDEQQLHDRRELPTTSPAAAAAVGRHMLKSTRGENFTDMSSSPLASRLDDNKAASLIARANATGECDERQRRRPRRRHRQQLEEQEMGNAGRSGKSSKRRRLVGNAFSGVNFVDPEFTRPDRRDEPMSMAPEVPRNALARDRSSDIAGTSMQARAASSSKEMLWSAWTTPQRSLSSLLTKDPQSITSNRKSSRKSSVNRKDTTKLLDDELEQTDLENSQRVPAGFSTHLVQPATRRQQQFVDQLHKPMMTTNNKPAPNNKKRATGTNKCPGPYYSPHQLWKSVSADADDDADEQLLMEGSLIPRGPINHHNKPPGASVATANGNDDDEVTTMTSRKMNGVAYSSAAGDAISNGMTNGGRRGRWGSKGREVGSGYRGPKVSGVGYCQIDAGCGRNSGAIKGGRALEYNNGATGGWHYHGAAGDGVHRDGDGQFTYRSRRPVSGNKGEGRFAQRNYEASVRRGISNKPARVLISEEPEPSGNDVVILKAKNRPEVSTNPVRDRLATSQLRLSQRSSYVLSQAVIVGPVTETEDENDPTTAVTVIRRPTIRRQHQYGATAASAAVKPKEEGSRPPYRPTADATVPPINDQQPQNAASPSTAPTSAAAMKALLHFFDRKLDVALSGRTNEPAAVPVERDIATVGGHNATTAAVIRPDDDDNGKRTLSLGFRSRRRSSFHQVRTDVGRNDEETKDRKLQRSPFRPYRQLPSSSTARKKLEKDSSSTPTTKESTSPRESVYFGPFASANNKGSSPRTTSPHGHDKDVQQWDFRPFSLHSKKKKPNKKGVLATLSTAVSNQLSMIRAWCTWQKIALAGATAVATGVAYNMAFPVHTPPSHCRYALHYYLNPECHEYN